MSRNNTSELIGSTYSERLVFIGLTTLLIVSPLFQAGELPLPLMFLEIIGLFLLSLILWQSDITSRLRIFSTPGMILWWMALLFPLSHLIPIPWKIWANLPGYGIYSEFITMAQAQIMEWRSIAVIPYLAERAWLTLLPPFAVFVGVIFLSKPYHKCLIVIVVIVAVVETLLGLMQFGAGKGSPACLGNTVTCGDGANGTFINRDHFAVFLELVFPVAIAMMFASIGRHTRPQSYSRWSWLRRMLTFSNWRAQATLLYAMASITLILGLIFTRSRMGVSLLILGIALTLIVFPRSMFGKDGNKSLGIVVAISMLIAIDIGLAPVLQRFVLADPLQDHDFES